MKGGRYLLKRAMSPLRCHILIWCVALLPACPISFLEKVQVIASGYAQDVLPVRLGGEKTVLPVDSVRLQTVLPLTKPAIEAQPCPTVARYSFFRLHADTLSGNSEALSTFYEPLAQSGSLNRPLRILHIGDSHVRGKVFPNTCGRLLEETFENVQCESFGVNGATCQSYSTDERMNRIASYLPDMLIISFGTNEGHDVTLPIETFHIRLGQLIDMLRERLGNIPMLLTTPPGAFYRGRINHHNSQVAQAIVDFGRTNGIPVFNLQEVAGGENAAVNWRNSGLIRRDGVHFTPEGYQTQGELLYLSIVNSYK